jgi:hypothetical protein
MDKKTLIIIIIATFVLIASVITFNTYNGRQTAAPVQNIKIVMDLRERTVVIPLPVQKNFPDTGTFIPL